MSFANKRKQWFHAANAKAKPATVSTIKNQEKPSVYNDIQHITNQLNALVKETTTNKWQVKLVIDTRELRNKEFVDAMAALDSSYKEIIQLTTGDYHFLLNRKLVWPGERKSLPDLCASILNSHLRKQTTEMITLLKDLKGDRSRIFYIIESRESASLYNSTPLIKDTNKEAVNDVNDKLLLLSIVESNTTITELESTKDVQQSLDYKEQGPSLDESYTQQTLHRSTIVGSMVNRFVDGYRLIQTENGAYTAYWFLKILYRMMIHAQEVWDYYQLETQPDYDPSLIRQNEDDLKGDELRSFLTNRQDVARIKEEDFPLTMTRAQRDLAEALKLSKSMTAPYAIHIAQQYASEIDFYAYILQHRTNPQQVVDDFSQQVPVPSNNIINKRFAGARVINLFNKLCGTDYKTKISGKKDKVITSVTKNVPDISLTSTTLNQ